MSSTQPWIRHPSWRTGCPKMGIPVDSRGLGSPAPVPEWQQCELAETFRRAAFLHQSNLSISSDFSFSWILGRKLSGMQLNGTLGYNMNQLTALVQLLVRSFMLSTLSAPMVKLNMWLFMWSNLIFCSDMSNNNLGGSDVPYNLPPNLESLWVTSLVDHPSDLCIK